VLCVGGVADIVFLVRCWHSSAKKKKRHCFMSIQSNRSNEDQKSLWQPWENGIWSTILQDAWLGGCLQQPIFHYYAQTRLSSAPLHHIPWTTRTAIHSPVRTCTSRSWFVVTTPFELICNGVTVRSDWSTSSQWPSWGPRQFLYAKNIRGWATSVHGRSRHTR